MKDNILMDGLKVDLIYYMIHNDFELEFDLLYSTKMRILSNIVDNLKDFLRAMDEATMRSQIIIVVGALYGKSNIIESVSRAINRNVERLNKTFYKVKSLESIILPNDAIPLVTENSKFGGCIVESGPQSIIILSENKEIRKEILHKHINPYLKKMKPFVTNDNTARPSVQKQEKDLELIFNKPISFLFPLKTMDINEIKKSYKPVFVDKKEIVIKNDEFYERVIFSGYLSNGIPIGNGKFIYDTNDIFEGSFSADGLPKEGKRLYTNGDSFEGEFLDGEVSKGIFEMKNGDVFIGEFVDEYITHGKAIYTDGHTYEGTFNCGIPEGHGTIDWNNGIVYNGEVFGGLPHGKGILSDKNKKLMITGDFFCGKANGTYQIRIMDDNKE